MIATEECFYDFKYDEWYLSNFGFVVCNFEGTTDVDVIDGGSKIVFNKVSRHKGRIYSLVGSTYDECITATFDICKNPDVNIQQDMEISDYEYRDLARWLNRRDFHEFQIVESDVRYNASFNLEKIKVDGRLYGIRLTMETDKPFGYGKELCYNWQIENTSKIFSIKDTSDEIGSIYPAMEIVCHQSGDLVITNSNDSLPTVIKNCVTGETITINGMTQIIQSSIPSHAIQNDFNFEFFKISNTLRNRDNKITFSLPCSVKIVYSPIIKNIPDL